MDRSDKSVTVPLSKYIDNLEDDTKFMYDKLKQKGLKMLHLNIRSLLRNIDEVKLLLTQNIVHIFSVNETWLDESVSNDEINIDGFRVVRKDRNRNGGGIAIYIRNDLNFKVLEHISLNNLEALPLLIGTNHAKPFVFVSWYRPPNSPICIFDYYEELLVFLDNFHHDIIIMGDINCDIKKLPLTNNTKRLNEINTVFSLQQINVTTHTRISGDSLSLIDHMVSLEMVKSYGVIYIPE